jgi:hypothetical protein
MCNNSSEPFLVALLLRLSLIYTVKLSKTAFIGLYWVGSDTNPVTYLCNPGYNYEFEVVMDNSVILRRKESDNIDATIADN